MPKIDRNGETVRDEPIPNNHLGMIEITKIVREDVPLTTGPDGYHSIGAMVDEILQKSIQAGDEIQTFTLHLAEEKWGNIRSFYGAP